MTALTPASAHACLEHIRILAAKAEYRQLPNVRTMTRLTGAGFGGWSIFANGGTHTIVVGWRAVARSPRGECYVMFGPVIADEAHEARAAACQQTNNTAKVCGIIEALQFFMTLGLAPRDSRVLHFPGPHSMPPMYALVPHQHGPTFDWLGLVSTFSYRYNCESLSLCVTSNATEIMLGMSVQITRRHSKPLDLCPTTTLSNAGRSRCSVLPIS